MKFQLDGMEPDSKKFWTSCVTWWPLIVQNLWKSDLSSWCTITFDRFNFSFYFWVRNRFNKTFFILSVIGPSHLITLKDQMFPLTRTSQWNTWLWSPHSSHRKSVPCLIHSLGNETCFSSSLITLSHGRSLCFFHQHVTKSSYTSISKKLLPR